MQAFLDWKGERVVLADPAKRKYYSADPKVFSQDMIAIRDAEMDWIRKSIGYLESTAVAMDSLSSQLLGMPTLDSARRWQDEIIAQRFDYPERLLREEMAGHKKLNGCLARGYRFGLDSGEPYAEVWVCPDEGLGRRLDVSRFAQLFHNYWRGREHYGRPEVLFEAYFHRDILRLFEYGRILEIRVRNRKQDPVPAQVYAFSYPKAGRKLEWPMYSRSDWESVPLTYFFQLPEL